MNWLATQKNTIFLGQAVRYAGTGLYDSLVDVPDSKKLEFPVAENLQMGVSTGLALQGYIPISIYPRWNFLISATDQIVNHLDKFSLINHNCNPKVIIRVAIGTIIPVDPQEQHKGNFSHAFRSMLKTINVFECFYPEAIFSAYEVAYESPTSSIIVEYPDFGKVKK